MQFPTCRRTKVIIHHSIYSPPNKCPWKSNLRERYYDVLNLQTVLGIQEAFTKLNFSGLLLLFTSEISCIHTS